MTCAVCIREIVGQPHREPLGKDDAIVSVCHACATNEVVPKQHVAVRSMREGATANDRSERIKRFRRELADRGICIYGEKHGKATHGKLCEACSERERNNGESRR